MIRMQIQLTEEQAERVRDVAHERGVSISRLVREAVDRLLDAPGPASREQLKRRALLVVGKYSSGEVDVAERHDEHLAEIYGRRDA